MIEAFVNNKDIVTIICDKQVESFYLDSDSFFPTLVKEENGKYIYKGMYELDYSHTYFISSCADKTILKYNLVIKESFFDDLFYYDADDLGSSYNKNYTIFKTWAPIASSVILKLINNGKEKRLPMENLGKGIFYLKVNGNLENALYSYLITNNGVEQEVNDIYSYSGNANFKLSAVINNKRLYKTKNYQLKDVKNPNEAIIYETSIRDFTSKLDIENKMTFKGFILEGLKSDNNNPIGFDYLKGLGITHLQLMPVTAIATIDDLNPNAYYNWGYDPLAYNILEGSYSLNPNDPYSRINEFLELVDKCHENNIRVCLDMVFNHTYFYENSIYNKVIPLYFYLMDDKGNLSNGSFCGNDIDSSKKMVSKYIIDMAKRLVSFYKIDGIRLDLMGILDIKTINQMYEECKKINPSFILYGEGWNMPSMLKDEKRASLTNSQELPHISFFNDTFRDTIRGKQNPFEAAGYLEGNVWTSYHAIRALRGCVENGCYFNDALQSINYLDCHDNLTLFDKMHYTNKSLADFGKNKLTQMALCFLLTSLGIPFIHSGMEFNRSKDLCENSYNKGDIINGIDWTLVDKYQENIELFKKLIEIRKSHQAFYMHSKKEILNHVDGITLDDAIIRLTYAIDGTVIIIYYNPTAKKYSYELDTEYRSYIMNNDIDSSDHIYDKINIKPYSFIILYK